MAQDHVSCHGQPLDFNSGLSGPFKELMGESLGAQEYL